MTPRRGFTFLEIVLSAAMLSLSAAALIGALDSARRISQQQKHRLDAVEVAHRLILNYLLDPESLPRDGQRIEQGRHEYRHVLHEEILVEDEDASDQALAVRRARPQRDTGRNARLASGLKRITIEVYHYRKLRPSDDRPLVTLSRIYNPLIGDEDVLIRQVQDLMGQQFQLPALDGDQR